MKSLANKKCNINFLSILISIFSVIFIIGGALIIYYFSKGYRLDISGREIRKTGVLTVQSEPSGAQLYINNESIGRTPRSRTLDVGTYNISVLRDDYREWKKQVEIFEEKSTPIFPFLILENPTMSNIWASEGLFEKHWINEKKDYFIFLQKDTEGQYSLWSYRVNTPLWNLAPNPVQIVSIDTNSLDLNISDNGQLAVMTISKEAQETIYLIDLTKPTNLELLKPIALANFSEYRITWSKDNKHLIMESDTEILSLDTNRNLPLEETSLILQKESNNTYLWSTDEEGFFYILEPLHAPEDNTYSYALKQIQPDGTNPKYMIEKVYFQKDREFIDHYRENGDTYPEFKNSPQSTQTIGEIIYFEVNQTSKGVYISTDTSTYWYDISTNRYRMICAHPASLISFSPDSKRVLFANGNYLYVFTITQDDGDYTQEIGTRKVENILKNEVENVAWLSNSMYLYYSKDNSLYISEKDGENNADIMNLENVFSYAVKANREHLVTLELLPDQPLQINQYRIK